MPAALINFPVSLISDCLLSYIQHLFTNPELTPASYRWSGNDRDGRIRISAPFSIDNEKPLSAPFIVVERGGFTFANQTIDNLKGADANSFENPSYADWADGIVSVICGSGVAPEASSIANFLAIMFQADRHEIKKTSRFIRKLNYIDIGPEMPVIKDVEVKRWEVTLRLFVSLNMQWIKTTREPVLWKKAAIYTLEDPPEVFSSNGIISEGESTLTDASKNFGFTDDDDPNLIQQDLERGWYYIRFTDNPQKQLYTITEIIDKNTVKLQTHDEENNPVDWVSSETKTDVEYELYWNSLHVHMELPKGET